MPAEVSASCMSTCAAISAERIRKSGSAAMISSRFGSLTLPSKATPSPSSIPRSSTASTVAPTSDPPASTHVSAKLPYSEATRSQPDSCTVYPSASVNVISCAGADDAAAWDCVEISLVSLCSAGAAQPVSIAATAAAAIKRRIVLVFMVYPPNSPITLVFCESAPYREIRAGRSLLHTHLSGHAHSGRRFQNPSNYTKKAGRRQTVYFSAVFRAANNVWKPPRTDKPKPIRHGSFCIPCPTAPLPE